MGVTFPTHPHAKDGPVAAEFGTLLGITHGGVQVFSCDYDSIMDKAICTRSDFQSSSDDGTFFGFKWQCVELARRYLVINHGVTFESIPMAYDIFDLKNVKASYGLKMVSLRHFTCSIFILTVAEIGRLETLPHVCSPEWLPCVRATHHWISCYLEACGVLQSDGSCGRGCRRTGGFHCYTAKELVA